MNPTRGVLYFFASSGTPDVRSFVYLVSKTGVLVAQLDKASDYESEDWGFKSLQGYVFIFLQSGTTRSVLHILSGVDSRRYSSVGRASD